MAEQAVLLSPSFKASLTTSFESLKTAYVPVSSRRVLLTAIRAVMTLYNRTSDPILCDMVSKLSTSKTYISVSDREILKTSLRPLIESLTDSEFDGVTRALQNLTVGDPSNDFDDFRAFLCLHGVDDDLSKTLAESGAHCWSFDSVAKEGLPLLVRGSAKAEDFKKNFADNWKGPLFTAACVLSSVDYVQEDSSYAENDSFQGQQLRSVSSVGHLLHDGTLGGFLHLGERTYALTAAHCISGAKFGD